MDQQYSVDPNFKTPVVTEPRHGATPFILPFTKPLPRRLVTGRPDLTAAVLVKEGDSLTRETGSLVLPTLYHVSRSYTGCVQAPYYRQ